MALFLLGDILYEFLQAPILVAFGNERHLILDNLFRYDEFAEIYVVLPLIGETLKRYLNLLIKLFTFFFIFF
jgi:hypothetical protein